MALYATLLAALLVALVESALVAVVHRPGAADLAWLALATVALTVPLAAVVALAGSRLRRRRVLGGALVAAAIALHVVNALAYVRLYLLLHLGLTAGGLVAATLGVSLALPELPLPKRLRALAAAAIVAWAALFALSLAQVTGSAGLRVLALDRSTVLAHELLLLDAASGILETDPLPAGAGQAALEPAPLVEPAGPLRGANVLLVTIDSLRADRAAAVERLAALGLQGTTFEQTWAPSCWTIHSMAATLASRLPSAMRWTWVSIDSELSVIRRDDHDPFVLDPANLKKVTPVPLDDPSPTLASLLAGAGYDTATAVGYVFYLRAAGLTDDFARVDESTMREHNRDNQGVTSVPLTDRALALLRERPAGKPFFLWVHYLDPHAPYVGGYDGELRLVDRELGRLLDAVGDDAIVIIHADHGEEFGDHGGKYHATTLYEEIVHVPLVIRLPPRAGAPAGARVTTPVSLLDLTPTVLDLVGVPSRSPLAGRSLVPLLYGRPLAPRPLVAECRRFGRDRAAVLDWPAKLIVDRALGTVELYDLAADPRERDNRADRDRATAERLAGYLTR